MEGEEGEGEGEGEGESICQEGKYCFNTPGSYRCNGKCEIYGPRSLHIVL